MSMFHPATVRPLLTLGAGQGHTCQPHGEAPRGLLSSWGRVLLSIWNPTVTPCDPEARWSPRGPMTIARLSARRHHLHAPLYVVGWLFLTMEGWVLPVTLRDSGAAVTHCVVTLSAEGPREHGSPEPSFRLRSEPVCLQRLK